MNEETDNAGYDPEEFPIEASVPPPLPVEAPARPFSYYVHRVLVCNPFYLASALLLLYGLYRVSVDPRVFSTEMAQLAFNFTSLQVYEMLLVVTAIALARRFIWNDATLLVVLENLFLFVPFMLVSQAALIERPMAWVLCVFAAALVALRMGSMVRWLPTSPLTRTLAAIGLVALLVNAALPMVFRHLNEEKIGVNIDSGPAYLTNVGCWLLLLPLICALVNLLPCLRDYDGELPVQRRWFPVTIFSLWAVGTGVHLYALSYVYNYQLGRELFAPALWVLAWTLFLRLDDFLDAPVPALRTATLALPLLVTLVAAGVTDSYVFLVLTALNVVGFGIVWLSESKNRLALHLLIITVSFLVAACPQLVHFTSVNPVTVASLLYLLLCAVWSRDPKAAVGGAIAAAVVSGVLFSRRDDDVDWAIQTAFVFFFLHSLRWQDEAHKGAKFVRAMAAVLWVACSFGWVRCGVAFWEPMALGGAVLMISGLVGWFMGGKVRRVVPAAAALVLLCAPANLLLVKFQAAPAGIVAIAASFLVFGLGTAVAFTKHRWFRHEPT